MEKQEKNTFEYTYSAPTETERKVIDNIRRQYVTEQKEKDAFTRLKELDGKVKNTAIVWSLIFGVVGTLIFGLGLTMILEWSVWLWGVVFMAIGAIPVALAYPVYNFFIARGKKKHGQEIVELSEKLLK